MTQFEVKPTIQICDTCAELAQALELGPKDLILTNQYIYDPYFGPLNLSCPTIFQEKYGAGEPSDEMVTAIYNDMPKDVTRIVAVGGGTVVDIAKVLSLKTVTPILDLYDGKIPLEKGKELILVPTTCGTGSEVTNLSILALISLNTKKGLGAPCMFGDKAVLVPELLKTLPLSVFATSSIDALIHSIESSLSPKPTPSPSSLGTRPLRSSSKGYMEIRDKGAEARIPLLKDFLLAQHLRRHRLWQRRLRRGPRFELPPGRRLPCAPRGVQLRHVHRRHEEIHVHPHRRGHRQAQRLHGRHPGL